MISAPPRERLDGVTYELLDVRKPIPEHRGNDADVIYNLAAVHTTPGHAHHEYYETNIRGALNVTRLAEACRISRIAFTSPISTCGPSEEVKTESSKPSPSTAYGWSKLLAEHVHTDWQARAQGRRLVIVRLGVVFGPGEGGNYTRLIRALKGGYFIYPGSKSVEKSGGYVGELLDSLDFTLERQDPNILYNFAYPSPSTTESIVHEICRVVGIRRCPVVLPRPALMLGASLFECLNAIGIRNTIHKERVEKLVKSTRILPEWLLENGYRFNTEVGSGLELWGKASGGRFE